MGAWPSVADYIAYRLTGEFGTDYSLACRTVVFDIDRKQWDEAWLNQWDLTPDLFPASRAERHNDRSYTHSQFWIPLSTPVAIGGHDHLCAALAADVSQPGEVFDSIGTAEVLIGAFRSVLPPRRIISQGWQAAVM